MEDALVTRLTFALIPLVIALVPIALYLMKRYDTNKERERTTAEKLQADKDAMEKTIQALKMRLINGQNYVLRMIAEIRYGIKDAGCPDVTDKLLEYEKQVGKWQEDPLPE